MVANIAVSVMTQMESAGAAVWDQVAASVKHAEGLMTPEQRRDFWAGLGVAASRAMVRSIGAVAAREVLAKASAHAALAAPDPAD
jgi:hypothetical protein